MEAALLEAAVLDQRSADLTGADDDDLPLSAQPEDLAEAASQLGHGITQPALAERPEEGEVLPDLGGRSPTAPSEFVARDGLEASALKVLEEPQVRRQAADGGIGDSLHDVRFL